MKKLMRYFIGSCLGLTILTSFAGQPAEELAKLLNSYTSYSASFSQVTYEGKQKNSGQKSSGFMALERPGLFRWEAKTPTHQIIVTNKKKLWIYDVDLEQVSIKPMSTEVGGAPAALLSNSTQDVLALYDITHPKNKDGNWYDLTPKDPNKLYQKISLNFENERLSQMNIKGNLGQKTHIQFSNIKVNSKLASNLFKLKLPKNVDVIRQK